MELTEQPSEIMQRIRAIPATRRVLVPNNLSQDAAGLVATEVLRLSAESQDDILLFIATVRKHHRGAGPGRPT